MLNFTNNKGTLSKTTMKYISCLLYDKGSDNTKC